LWIFSLNNDDNDNDEDAFINGPLTLR